MKNLINNFTLDINLLIEYSQKPPVFTPGEALFWNDEHISKGMLKAHLNPDIDAASRNHSTIDKTTNFLSTYLKIKKDDKILDLGCGPGLYCTKFINYCNNITGIDYSNRSINYAIEYSTKNSLPIKYVYGDYTNIDYPDIYDYIFLIYYDLGVLCDKSRNVVLQKINNSLKIGGYFIFDVATKNYRKDEDLKNNWYVCNEGFWKSSPHLVLEKSFHYPEHCTFSNEYTVIDENGDIKVYRTYDHYYDIDTITTVLNENGFSVEVIWSDLTGTPYDENSNSLGIVAKKTLALSL